jgi:PAS domain S-box-containing protein
VDKGKTNDHSAIPSPEAIPDRCQDELFQMAFDKVAIGFCLTDGSGRFLRMNEAFCRLTGFSAEELQARDLPSLLHPEDRGGILQGFRRLIAGEISSHFFEGRYLVPSGEVLWVQHTIALLPGKPPTNSGFAVVAQDIAVRKRAESALRESEDRYRDLVEHSQDLICTHDLDGVLLSVNEAPLRILGYSREELLNKPLRDFVTPAARPLCDAYLAQIQKEGSARGLLPVLTKDGQVRLWEYHNSLRSEGVRTPVVRGLAHDVTDQKRAESALRKSEEKFSKAFRSSPVEMVITTLSEGRFLDANESFLRSAGFAREEVIGRTSLELGIWADPADRAAIVEEVRNNGRIANREVQLRTKTGLLGAKLYSAELISISGESCLLSVGRDITEQKRAMEEVRQLSRRLLNLQDEERRKIALELHDSTGQNLVALTALLSRLRAAFPSPDGDSRGVFFECERLAKEYIQEIRTLSYLLFPPTLSHAEIESAVRHYADGFVERTGIRVELETPPGLGRMPHDIELALFRVVQESLTNIQRHSGSPTATVRIRREPESVLLEVADQGRGFSLFEDKGRSGFRRPLGVGIESMIERIKHVGGDLGIESSKEGTTVFARVPIDGQSR